MLARQLPTVLMANNASMASAFRKLATLGPSKPVTAIRAAKRSIRIFIVRRPAYVSCNPPATHATPRAIAPKTNFAIRKARSALVYNLDFAATTHSAVAYVALPCPAVLAVVSNA
jgi:hypothetical protein